MVAKQHLDTQINIHPNTLIKIVFWVQIHLDAHFTQGSFPNLM